MKRIFSVILCCTLIFGFSAFAEDETEFSPFTGVSIYENGEKVFSSGSGSAVPIGSVSKTYAAVLIMKLSEENLLDIDEAVVKYLPDFKMEDDRYTEITVKMLMNHSSGIYGSTLKNAMLYGEYSSWNHDNILLLLSRQRLKYKPGEMQNYCNDGYTLLELIAERVTGKSYSELFDEYIKLPLGLSDTVTAAKYEGDCKDIVSALASGGILSNTDELCAFGCALADGNIVSGKSLALMAESFGEDEGMTDFGLGFDDVSGYPFDKYGIKALIKDGDTLSGSASLLIIPALGIATAVTAEGQASTSCRMKAIKQTVEYLNKEKSLDIEFYDYEFPDKMAGDAEECKSNEGVYLSNGGQYRFKISKGYGVLENLYTGTSTKYEYIGDGNFMYRGELLYFEGAYMKKAGTAHINSEDKFCYDYYFAEKKEDVTEEIPEAWQTRNGKVYFICDEAYNSELYMSSVPLSSIYFADGVGNYVGYMKLSGDNEAISALKLPGSYGRDLTDVSFFEANGTEYLSAQGWTFMDYTSIPDIYPGEKSVATIGEEGYARWFKVGEAAGKRISAEAGDKAMTAVYSAKGEFLFSSLLSDEEFVLPEGGYIAFVGSAGTKFDITLN